MGVFLYILLAVVVYYIGFVCMLWLVYKTMYNERECDVDVFRRQAFVISLLWVVVLIVGAVVLPYILVTNFVQNKFVGDKDKKSVNYKTKI